MQLFPKRLWHAFLANKEKKAPGGPIIRRRSLILESAWYPPTSNKKESQGQGSSLRSVPWFNTQNYQMKETALACATKLKRESAEKGGALRVESAG